LQDPATAAAFTESGDGAGQRGVPSTVTFRDFTRESSRHQFRLSRSAPAPPAAETQAAEGDRRAGADHDQPRKLTTELPWHSESRRQHVSTRRADEGGYAITASARLDDAVGVKGHGAVAGQGSAVER